MWSKVACAAGVGVGVVAILLGTRRKRKSEAPPRHLEGGRPLGYAEWMVLDSCENGSGQTCRVFIISSRQAITQEIVREALERLVAIHPPLRMRLAYHDGRPWMVPMKQAQVDLETLQGEYWQRVVEEELLLKFNLLNGPLWRAKFLPNVSYAETSLHHPYQAALVLSFNHVVGDGVGIIMMFNDLLNILDDVIVGRETTIAPTEGLPPSVEQCLGLEPETGLLPNIKYKLLSFLLRFQCVRLLLFSPFRNQFLDEIGSANEKADYSKIKTSIITKELPDSLTSKLLAACRANRCSVTFAIHAASSYAVTAFWTQNGGNGTNVQLYTFILHGLRNREIKGKAATYKLANYMSSMEFNQTLKSQMLKKDQFWQTARDIQQKYRKALEKKLHVKTLRIWMDMYRIGYRMPAVIDDLWKRPVPRRHGVLNTMFIINNMGNCSYLDRTSVSSVRLLACHQAASIHRNGPLFFNYLITFQGKLFLTVNYCPYVISEKVALKPSLP